VPRKTYPGSIDVKPAEATFLGKNGKLATWVGSDTTASSTRSTPPEESPSNSPTTVRTTMTLPGEVVRSSSSLRPRGVT
jgi:hypothetical protein